MGGKYRRTCNGNNCFRFARIPTFVDKYVCEMPWLDTGCHESVAINLTDVMSHATITITATHDKTDNHIDLSAEISVVMTMR